MESDPTDSVGGSDLMPPISTENNPNYGGPEGNNKYSPLQRLQLVAADMTDCNNLVNGRVGLLANTSTFPSGLTLYASNWAGIGRSEGTQVKPPIVVVSSNRSTYIKTGVETVDTALRNLNIGSFNNISDVRPLLGAEKSSPPVYLPKRLGPAPRRSVYVVVHAEEYTTYQSNLQNSGIIVIGWAFNVIPMQNYRALTGFGATRYAAIEFCKHLRHLATINNANPGTAPWDEAWMFDDNVVGFASGPALGLGFPQLLADAEANMSDTTVVAGFHGLPVPRTQDDNERWASQGTSQEQEGLVPQSLPAAANRGLVQQAGLWNIDYLKTNNLNFSSIFIASKEDVSFTYYFDQQDIVYQWYRGVDILKEIVPTDLYDDSLGSKHVNDARQSWLREFAIIEANTQLQLGSGSSSVLKEYVKSVVLRVSKYLRSAENDDAAQDRGVTCAVEQIITKAIINVGTGRSFLGKPQLKSMFEILATTPQAITAIDQ